MIDSHFYDPVKDYASHFSSFNAIAILPIYGISIKEKIELNEFTLYPRFRLNHDNLNLESTISEKLENLNKYEKADIIRENEKDILDVFGTHCLIAFPINFNHKEVTNPTLETALIKVLSEDADKVVNLIRFYSCDYNEPFKLIPNAGYCQDKYSSALIYYADEKILKVYRGLVLNLHPSHPSNLIINDSIENHVLTKAKADIGEVGNIASHALLLNSQTLMEASSTSKFLLIMQLIDFLMLPYNYKSFSKAKGNFICHIAKNKQEYHKLSKRFRELTDKNGLRTKIIHGGETIESLIDLSQIDSLFKELQGYIKINIESLIKHYEKTWDDFELIRITLKDSFK